MAKDVTVEAASLFDHGGEMGALMGAIDWARTPLGPVSGWSQALRTMVGLLLRNRFPLLLWWGPRFVQLYNDAYRPIPGEKHPRSLGQPAAECWPEIWDVIGPMIEAPFHGGDATWSDDLALMVRRKGFLEETHFKVAYSPVPDESTASGIGGVLATVAETTEEVYARRQLATLRDLAARASDAKTAEQACETAARTLAANARDVPCALLYLLGAEGEGVRLVGAAGFDHASPDPHGLPLERVMRERRAEIVELGAARLPSGAWDQPPDRAVILPLASPDQATAYGVLVAAASPHRELDEPYLSFLLLAAEHVASAIRNARAYQHERERAEKLAEIDRAKTLFFSNVSHEFRTPLTLMLAPIDDMRAAPRGDDGDRERLDLLHRNAMRMLKLVNNLLDFSRIEAGRVKAAYEPTDLAALTADLASTFRSALERAGLALVVDCPPLPEPTWVDRGMWEKIVLNLLSNAFKFTFDGEIAVRLREADGGVELEIHDTGTGIPAHELPRLFERFHRIEGARSRSHEGSGIGLALVHELVRLHGGEIQVESREGAGTTFRVRVPRGSAHLPRDRTRPQRAPHSTAVAAEAYVEEALRWVSPSESAPQAPALTAATNAPRARIVVADDNADMRDYLVRLLREHWDVEAVADGHAALAAIRRRPPDLVLSDVMMPGLDGFGLLRAVREDAVLGRTPFILLSARAGEEAVAEGLEAGADDYLVKPFTARELLVRVTTRLAAAATAHALLEQRTGLYRAFMQAPFPVAIFRGPTHVFEAANDALLGVWGKSASIIGRPLLEALPELREQPFPALLDEVYRTGTPHQGHAELARIARGAGGKLEDVYFNYVYAPLFDPRGAVEGLMVCAFDVTEQVRVGRLKDEFLATLSHELRTPLNAVLGWTSMLRKDRGDEARITRRLETIERNAQSLARLVNDLLDVSRIVTGKLRLTLKSTELASVIRAAVDVVRPAADARSVTLVVDLAPCLGEATVDPERLQQVVWNLVSNAVRFTPAGGRVTVSAQRGASTVTLRVRDTGAGIAPEHLVHVFDRFRQFDSSTTRSHGGLGLGLAIVRHLVEAHGGGVTASSDGLGTGATFTVTLPVAAASARELEGAADAGADAAREPAGAPVRRSRLRGIRVLIVDDDEDSLELLRVSLEEEGATVTARSSAREALDAEGPFDLVISDIGMPEVDGYTLVRSLRARDVGGDVPAIALTAYARAEDVQHALRCGYQEHLAKPIDPQRLLEAVTAWTDRGRSASA